MNPAAVLSILVKTQGITAATGQLEALDKTADKSAKSSSAAGKAIGLAFKASAVGAGAVGAGLIGAVKASATFEKQMSSLKAVTDSNAKTMGEFKKQAIDAGIATSFSAKQAAEAQTELAKGGLSVANIMGGGLKSALSLAAAGNLDLGEAAATTANAMNLFGLKGEKSKMVADQLAMAANATTADVHDFSEALKQGGSVAKSAGLSFTQTNVALEALAAAGIKGSDAGTSLKTALLQMIAPSSTKAAAAMEEFGLKFTDANGNMKSMADISSMLRDKLGKMTAAQRTSTLATIVGTDGVRTLTSLYDAGPKKLDAFRKGLEKQGTAAKVAATMQDNLSGKLEQFKGTIETIAIVVGDKLRPTVQDVVERLTDFANGLLTGQGAGGRFRDAMVSAFTTVKETVLDTVASVREFIQEFQDGQAKAVAIGAALAGLAAGVVTVQALTAATKAWAAAQLAVNLAMDANPFVIAAAALAALGVAFYVAYQKSETFRNAVDAVFAAVKGAMTDTVAWIQGAVKTVVDEVSEWKLLFAVVAAAWDIYFTILKTEVKVFAAVVIAVFKTAMAVLGPIVSGAWSGVKQIFTGAFHVIEGLVKIFGGVLKGDFGQIWDGIKQVFSGAWDVLKGVVRAALGAIVGYVKAVPGRMASAALDIGKAIATGIVDGLGSLGHLILDKVKDALDFVTDHLPGVGSAISIGKSIAGKIGDGAGQAAKTTLPSGAGLAGGSLMGAKSIMSPFVSMAGRFGLQTSSGLRPGAITSSGNPSFHGSGNAVDEAGSPQGMMGYFRFLKANYGSRLRELIYTPGGVGIKDGKPFTYTGQVAADHFDHVHVAFTGGAGDGIGNTRIGQAQGALALMGDGLGVFEATAYGPPWNAMNGSGVTANGTDLRPAKKAYGVAVDPSVISLGSKLKITPNPFSYSGAFTAFDTGGAIKGNRIDFYDWRGRAAQNGWGRRTVKVSAFSAASKTPSSKSGPSKGSSKSAAAAPNMSAAINAPESTTYADGPLTDPFISPAASRTQGFLSSKAPIKGKGPTKGFPIGFTPPEVPDAPAVPTMRDYLNRDLARAQLTEDTGDDRVAYQGLLADARGRLGYAINTGDVAGETEAYGDIKSLTDAIKSLDQTTEESNAALADALKGVQDELKRQTDFATSVTNTSNYQLTKTLADTIGGQIVGYGVAGRKFTPGTGTEYAY